MATGNCTMPNTTRICLLHGRYTPTASTALLVRSFSSYDDNDSPLSYHTRSLVGIYLHGEQRRHISPNRLRRGFQYQIEYYR